MQIDPDALPDDAATLQLMLRTVLLQQGELAAENDKMRLLIQRLTRHQFGRRSEQLTQDQLQLALEELEQTIAANQAGQDAVAAAAGLVRKPRAEAPARSEEASAISRPYPLAGFVASACRRDRVAAAKFGRERIACVASSGLRDDTGSFPVHLYNGCYERQHGEGDRARPKPPRCVCWPHRSVVEHCDGGGLIAGTGRQEALHLRLRLSLRGESLRALQALRAALSGQQRRHVGELL